MITPIRNISFNSIKKQIKINNKANFNSNENKKFKNSIYTTNSNISFKNYMPITPSFSFEYGVENNFFKLPKITKKDGTIIQIQPDKSQLACAKQLSMGRSVLFDAPTGMGKTSVAHFAIGKNLMENKKTVYTVPIKALANDKYNEFTKIYGENNVGILTGDRKINTKAPITIMTTEIFDNQAQSMSKDDADEIGTVIYDEAHYLGDANRGIAWEHSLINAASKGVQILALSATIGNADEIASWMGEISGARSSTRINVDSADRPVPLVWKIFQKSANGDDRLSTIVTGEIDLSKKIQDTSSDVINLIYEIEMDYYSRKHENAKNNSNYNNEFLKDEDYKIEIPKKLTRAFGKDWIQTNFSNKTMKKVLCEEFPSLIDSDIEMIANIASQSGIGMLSERQKLALEVIYKKEHQNADNYKMTNENYLDTYAKLKKAIGKGDNNFKYSTETFKKRLKEEFRFLDKTDLDYISQMMARTDVKNIRAIHENWSEDDYVRLVSKLKKEDMLPAIIFKLSQGGCEQVIEGLTDEANENLTEEEIQKQAQKLDLLTQNEKEQVSEIIKKYEKSGVYLGTNLQKDMLLKGWAVHHAGRMPQYKKLIEELFSKKLIKVVVATSTLGAGINMPTRTVVMTNTAYMKYNPETKQMEQEPISANEFHQMTGRAGRRGIDRVGNVVLYNLHTPTDKFRKEDEENKNGKIDELWHAYKMINSEPDNIRSSFRPQPVMIANHYLKENNDEGLWRIIKQSFKVHCSNDREKIEKQLFKKFENYTQALTRLGFIEKNHKKEIKLTAKGEILAQCQGMNPLLMASLLFDGKLDKMNPVQLAQVVGHIQGSSEAGETDEFLKLVANKVKYMQSKEPFISSGEFELTRNEIKNTEQKIIKALNESRVNKTDIEQTESFSGLVGYLFASLNEIDDRNSIKNFEKIAQTIDFTPSTNTMSNKEYKTKATEGNIYKIITGSISTLKQMIRVCDYALERPDLYLNSSYWETVKENAIIALELLDKEPINNNPNYES